MRLGVNKYIKEVNAENQMITTTIYNSVFEGLNPLKSINRQLNSIDKKLQLTNIFDEEEVLSSIESDPNFTDYIHKYDKWNNLRHTPNVKLKIFFKETEKEMSRVLSLIVEKTFSVKEFANTFTLEQVVNIFNHEVSGIS